MLCIHQQMPLSLPRGHNEGLTGLRNEPWGGRSPLCRREETWAAGAIKRLLVPVSQQPRAALRSLAEGQTVESPLKKQSVILGIVGVSVVTFGLLLLSKCNRQKQWPQLVAGIDDEINSAQSAAAQFKETANDSSCSWKIE